MTRYTTVGRRGPALAARDGGWKCHYCGVELASVRHTPERVVAHQIGRAFVAVPGFKLAVIHIVPRSSGGSDDLENLVLACADCNTRKGTKSYEEFIAA